MIFTLSDTRSGHDDWDAHWNRYAGSASENPAQVMRHALILRALRMERWPEDRLLDVGSGQGDFLAKASQAGAAGSYAGFELSEAGIRIAREKVPEAKLLQVNLFDPSDEARAFLRWATAAVCSDVIEHVDEPIEFLRALGDYLADGARLVITVPGGPMSAFDKHIGHRRHYTKALLGQTLAEAGFVVDQIWQAGFPFFNLYRLTVILRGRRLIADVESGGEGADASPLARFVMAVYRVLFKANLHQSPFGWQLVAIARKRAA